MYILCFLTSAVVSLLLLRAYHKTRVRILLWSGLGFLGLTLNNLGLIFDLMLFSHIELSMARTIPALLGMCVLLYGVVWDRE